jgi:hypothetical protein
VITRQQAGLNTRVATCLPGLDFIGLALTHALRLLIWSIIAEWVVRGRSSCHHSFIHSHSRSLPTLSAHSTFASREICAEAGQRHEIRGIFASLPGVGQPNRSPDNPAVSRTPGGPCETGDRSSPDRAGPGLLPLTAYKTKLAHAGLWTIFSAKTH